VLPLPVAAPAALLLALLGDGAMSLRQVGASDLPGTPKLAAAASPSVLLSLRRGGGGGGGGGGWASSPLLPLLTSAAAFTRVVSRPNGLQGNITSTWRVGWDTI
jgi:hypothetical protein